MAVRSVDYDKIAEYHTHGLADQDIADKAGCSLASVYKWRKEHGKKAHKRANPSIGVAKEDKAVPEQFICFLDGGTPAQLEWDMDDKEYIRDFCSKHKCIIDADLYVLGEEVGMDPDDVFCLIFWLIRIGQVKCKILIGR